MTTIALNSTLSFLPTRSSLDQLQLEGEGEEWVSEKKKKVKCVREKSYSLSTVAADVHTNRHRTKFTRSSVQLKMVSILSEKSIIFRSTLSLRSFPNVAFETVPRRPVV